MKKRRVDLVRRLTIGLVTAILALVWVSILARRRDPGGGGEPDPPASLNPWSFLGCYELSLDPWAGDVKGQGATGTATESDLPILPGRFLLLADSLDEWGRLQDTYRARPLDPGPPPGDAPFRWFVRADTLWLVWSDARLRGGVALRGSSSGLLGRARVTGRGTPLDVSARVEAWPINCSTLRREEALDPRRR